MNEPDKSCFCLEEMAESVKVLQAIRVQLPAIHTQCRKYRGTRTVEEAAALADMQAAVKRLWQEFPGLIQRLNEYGDAEPLQTAGRLYEVLKHYDYLGAADITLHRDSRSA